MRAVAATPGLVLTDYYVLDTERLKGFLRVAEKTGRTMVLQPQHMLMARRFAPFDAELDRISCPASRCTWRGVVPASTLPRTTACSSRNIW